MRKTREELRQELRQQSDELIEEVLDWYEAHDKPNMDQIENHVLTIREKLGRETAQVLIQAQETTYPTAAPPCPTCQQTMESKGGKDKNVTGLLGDVTINRTYYYCSACEAGFFPPRPTT